MDINKMKHWELGWDDSECEVDNGFGGYPFLTIESTNRQMVAPKWCDEWLTFNRLYNLNEEELKKELFDIIEIHNMHVWNDEKISKNKANWAIGEFLKYKEFIKQQIELGNRLGTGC